MTYDKPTIEYAKTLISYLPKRPDYELWVKIISSIGNTFSENESLDIILSYWTDERPNETLYKLRNKQTNISFGTLIYNAKINGYTNDVNPRKSIPDKHVDYLNRQFQKESEPEKIITDVRIDLPEQVFKWADEEQVFFDLAVKGEIEKGKNRDEVIEYYTRKFSESECIAKSETRLYDVMLNRHIINKPTDQNIIKSNQHKFVFARLSADEMMQNISKGYAFLPSILTPDGQGNFKRKNDYWSYSDLIVLDIDGGLKVDESLNIPQTANALFLYYTPSYTPENHRFRIVFALQGRCYNAELYKEIYLYYSSLYGADKQCKDLSRFYFGNSNTTLIDVQNGIISNYKNGELINE